MSAPLEEQLIAACITDFTLSSYAGVSQSQLENTGYFLRLTEAGLLRAINMSMLARGSG